MNVTPKEEQILYQPHKVFYKGVIEDNNDPTQRGRYKVRILGVHSPDTSIAPTATLPWAECINPIIFGWDKGTGISSIAVIGTWVWCFFDNDDVNLPIVVGGLTAQGDFNPRASGSDYINVNTLRTKSNHIIEIDDANNEMRILHDNGSEILLTTDNVVITSVTNRSEITVGRYTQTVLQSIEINANGVISINGGDSLNIGIFGNTNISTNGNTTIQTAGNTEIDTLGNTTVKTQGNTEIDTTGTTTIQSTGDITATTSGNGTINTSGNLSATVGGSLNVNASGSGTVQSSGAMLIKGSAVTIQGASTLVV